jgi:uncharacterized protein
MILDVARMDPDGEDVEGEDPVEILEWDFGREHLFYPVAPVRYRFHAQLAGREVLVTGSVATRFGGMCTRCGGPLDIEVRDDEFCQSFPYEEGADQRLDLTSEERISILLALPANPVCRPDCPGVCPRCGRRLADGPCDCTPEGSSVWDALSEFSLDAEDHP